MTRQIRPAAAGRLRRPLAALALAALSQAALAEEKPAEAAPPAAEPRVSLIGYGEINVNRPSNSANTVADLRRFVFGFLYRFDEKTKFVSEVEFEHAVTSADDKGEAEIEQAFIERRFTEVFSARAGLMLMPVGLLNENHEPTAYYGVERNFVETAIIPTTWREGGLQAVAALGNGFTLQAGLTTTFDLTKWDFKDASEGRASPLGSIHQELALAKAHDVGGFGAVNYRGIPGLLVGGFGFAGRASQGQPGIPSSTVSLWDVHARWTPWRLDLSALYTRGNISNTAALNTALNAPGDPTAIPESFDGWYAQGAIRAWADGDMALAPFVRYEQFNTGRSFADLGPGLTPAALETEGVFTAGLNFWVTSGVVLKADIQRFRVDGDQNRVDFGLGWSF